MNFSGRDSEALFDTTVATYQLNQLFGIESIFRRRGQKVARWNDTRGLLFEEKPGQCEKYYQAMNRQTFRRVLAAVTNFPQPVGLESIRRNSGRLSEETVRRHLEKALELGMLIKGNETYRGFRDSGFGSTFEWYIARVCERELASISYWGVRVEDLTGDYDVVLVRDTELGYIECKSGKFSRIESEDIRNFLIRESLLAPSFSIILLEQASRKNLSRLADYVLDCRSNYSYSVSLPGHVVYSGDLFAEEYKNFVRIVPLNCFIASLQRSARTVLTEIYRFLTLVGGRKLPMDNESAKKRFQLERVRERHSA